MQLEKNVKKMNNVGPARIKQECHYGVENINKS
jgi:hypothetical protein